MVGGSLRVLLLLPPLKLVAESGVKHQKINQSPINLSTIFIFGFGIVTTMLYFFFGSFFLFYYTICLFILVSKTVAWKK
jgi:hypothetical protein